ncbi:MAG TPA: hypothetical protein VFE16_00060 [Candidatus Cybelea sp.]|jgi:hypothetical protein|nr:hypothetical protein [Candidatus Cybelea sp.]
MIFLLVYDTRSAKLLEFKEYQDEARSRAMSELRTMQEALLEQLDSVEVCLFEADSRKTLEQTHSRYFKTLPQLSKSLRDVAKRPA